MLSTLLLRHVRAGLLAASIASVVVVLVSLPLKSPDDTMLNSLTVVIGVLTLGLAAGISWSILSKQWRGWLLYVILLVGVFLFISLIAVVAETQILEHFFFFAVPLSAIGIVITGILIPVLARVEVPQRWWTTLVAVLVALGLGIGLAGQGDEESGELFLPPRPVRSAALPALSQSPVRTAAATLTPAQTTVSGGDAQPAATRPAPTARPARTATPEPPELCSHTDGRCWIIGEGSEATFTVRERLVRLTLPNDAVVRTSQLSGEINLERPSVIDINLHSLHSDQRFRDRYMRNRMFQNSPIATFTVDDLGELPEGFVDGDEVAGQVTGTLSIRGVVVPLTFDLEVRDDGGVLNILGRTTFTWEQLQIPVPTARVVLWVADEVKVEILIQARLKGGEGG